MDKFKDGYGIIDKDYLATARFHEEAIQEIKKQLEKEEDPDERAYLKKKIDEHLRKGHLALDRADSGDPEDMAWVEEMLRLADN